VSESVRGLLWFSPVSCCCKKLAAVAQGQFGKPEEGECLPLEAVTRKLVKTEQAGKT
jgi:hypothetical protein